MELKSPIVWVVQQRSDMNFLPAQKYGEICYLFPATYQIQYSNQVQSEYDIWSGFVTDLQHGDYLVLAGDPLAIAVVTIYAYSKLGDGKLRFLKWDRQEKMYTVLQPVLTPQRMLALLDRKVPHVQD